MKRKLKSLLQYIIYPVIMIVSSIIIMQKIGTGENHLKVIISILGSNALLILTLEKILPYEKAWLNSKGDLTLDTTYYIINYFIKLVGQLLFSYIISRYTFLSVFPTSLPFFFQVILALIIVDFFLYLVHRLSHRYILLWKFHAIHHSSERLYWLNGEKRHALHQIIEGAPGILFCLVIGTSYEVLVAALGILAINMMLQHCNIDYKAGFLKQIFSVAELHRWHHRADYKDAQVNYGAWLIIWDKVFRTYYNEPKMNKGIGEIGIEQASRFPRSYIGQFFFPFK